MLNISWRYLQLFADGGEGAGGDGAGEGAAAATVVQPADDGQGELRKRGFTEAQIVKIQKDMARRSKAAQPATAKQEAPAQDQQNSAAAPQEAPPAVEEQQSKKTLKQLLKEDPDYNAQMQQLMQGRLKESKGKAESYDKLSGALPILAQKYGMDVDNLDLDAMAKAIMSDGDNISQKVQQKAVELGVDYDTAEGIVQQEQELSWMQAQDQARKEREEETLEQQRFNDHIMHMEQQATKLRESFPEFDLRKEMENPYFRRMTSPQIGISVEDAYYAIHRADIEKTIRQQAYQQAQTQIASSIQSGMHRPQESGSSSQAPTAMKMDYSRATADQRAAFKADLRRAWGRGETVYPNRG